MNNSSHSVNVVEQGKEEICSELSAEYVLYESMIENRLSYSIKVSLKETEESATVRDITSDQPKARHIFKMIRCGRVTPCCLFEVVEDLIESVQDISPSNHDFSILHENTL